MPGLHPPHGFSTLDSLNPGARAQVHLVRGDVGQAQALMEIGLHPGAEVRLIRRAPLGCPLEIAVDGGRFAIRRRSARQVLVARHG